MKKKVIRASAVAAPTLAVIWWIWADLAAGRVANLVQGQFFWLAPLVGLVVVASTAAALWARSGNMLSASLRAHVRHHDYGTNTRDGISGTDAVKKAQAQARAFTVVAVVVGLALAATMVIAIVRHGYDTRREYVAQVEETTSSAPALEERAAFRVAQAQAAGNLVDVRGTIDETTYLADSDTYTSLVRRNGNLQGYAAVEVQNVALTGQATSSICEFDADADKRLGGWFGHSLERAIAHERRGLIISDEDAYGYCDGDTPVVVVPVKELKGWFPAVEMPAGVVVYDGSTGELVLRDEVKAGEIPGPVFPISLARELRESSAALGGYWDYAKDRVGYGDTSGDVGDPNGGNASEFSLATTDGDDPVYVTPLTLRGRSSAIAAVGVVEAGSVTAGQLPTYQVHTLEEPRKANSAVADRLKSDYGDLPDWAAGMGIFEIAPVSSTEWVASLGREQNVSYRVRIMANGDSCLETAEGQEIRCGKVTATNGNGPGVALAPGGATGTTPSVTLPQSPEEIASLSDAELAQLQTQLSNEIADRLTAGQ